MYALGVMRMRPEYFFAERSVRSSDDLVRPWSQSAQRRGEVRGPTTKEQGAMSMPRDSSLL